MQSCEFNISGRVQGVGFRYFALTEAMRLGVKGWVRNENDGSVRCQASAPEAIITQFRESLAKGPSASRVDHLESVELLSTEDHSWANFEIRH